MHFFKLDFCFIEEIWNYSGAILPALPDKNTKNQLQMTLKGTLASMERRADASSRDADSTAAGV